ARTVHRRTAVLAAGLRKLGFAPLHDAYFDTVTVAINGQRQAIISHSAHESINLRLNETTVSIALDETTTPAVVESVWRTFGGNLSYAEIEKDVRDA
ncbi:hypothetical protein U9218_23750, partial [Escherichia coli]